MIILTKHCLQLLSSFYQGIGLPADIPVWPQRKLLDKNVIIKTAPSRIEWRMQELASRMQWRTLINIFKDYPRTFDAIDFLMKNIHALKFFNLGFWLFNKQMALSTNVKHFTRKPMYPIRRLFHNLQELKNKRSQKIFQ